MALCEAFSRAIQPDQETAGGYVAILPDGTGAEMGIALHSEPTGNCSPGAVVVFQLLTRTGNPKNSLHDTLLVHAAVVGDESQQVIGVRLEVPATGPARLSCSLIGDEQRSSFMYGVMINRVLSGQFDPTFPRKLYGAVTPTDEFANMLLDVATYGKIDTALTEAYAATTHERIADNVDTLV